MKKRPDGRITRTLNLRSPSGDGLATHCALGTWAVRRLTRDAATHQKPRLSGVVRLWCRVQDSNL